MNCTPGPWRTSPNLRINGTATDGIDIESVTGANIALVLPAVGVIGEWSTKETWANAHVFAAAWETFVALRGIEWSSGGHCPQCLRPAALGHRMTCTLAAALAKANGKPVAK